MRVAIIGAGPCGLSAAWELAEGGAEVVVLEKDRAAGGLCKTIRRGGFQFDLGGHRFISRDAELVDDVKKLMGARLAARQRRSCILFPDRRFEYPLSIADIIRNGSPSSSAMFAIGYAAMKAGLSRSTPAPGSFRHWVESRYGKPLYNEFFGPYTAKLWGVEPAQLSSEWAASRIPEPGGATSLLKAIGGGQDKAADHAAGYLYPIGGIGEIFETMAARIESLGGQFLWGHSVHSFALNGEKVLAARTEDENGEAQDVEADMFLSTAPLASLAAALGGSQYQLRHRGLRFLNIMLSGVENLSPYTWQYTPSQEAVMTRIQEPKRRSPASAPQGQTSVMLEIPCDFGSRLWEMDDQPLLAKALVSMQKHGYDLNDKVESVFSTRAEHAYPLLTLGSASIRENAIGFISQHSNLATLGRQGLFRYVFMDEAMLMGRRWARALLDGKLAEVSKQSYGSGSAIYEAGSVAV